MNIVDRVEGTRPPAYEEEGEMRCDYCYSEIVPTVRVSLYAADKDFGLGQDNFRIDRMYCDECARREIQLPCKGANEALFRATLGEDYRLRQVKLIDKSVQSDGVPWDPVEVWEEFMGISLNDFSSDPQIRSMKVAPEDIYDILELFGVPVDEIGENGKLIVSDERRKEIQEGITEKARQGFDALHES